MTTDELLYGILFEPGSTLRYISDKKPFVLGIVVYLIVLIFNAVFARGIGYISPKATAVLLGDFLWIYLLTGILFAIVVLFLITGLFSLFGDLFYGYSNNAGLLTCLCFASVPGVLGPPLQYSALLIGARPIGVVASIVISGWIIVLQVMALREALALKTSQAVILFIMPAILAILALGILILIIVSAIFSWQL